MGSVPTIERGYVGMTASVGMTSGLGCMGMTAAYDPAKPEQEMIGLIQKAVNHGITLLDTSDIYGGSHTNEILVGKGIKGVGEKVQICAKFGWVVGVFENQGVIGDAENVRYVCQASLESLDVDSIDVYYCHRVDVRVPIEDHWK